MSGKCGPTLVAVAAPDNWMFLGKIRPDERAVDFFHACERLGEVADRRDRTGTTASPCATRGVDKVGDTLSPRQGADENGDRGS